MRIKRMIAIWKEIRKRGSDFIILGDMNVCYQKWNSTDYDRKSIVDSIKNFLNESGASQRISGVTRVAYGSNINIQSCIDHIYTNMNENVVKTEVITVGDSDHRGIVARVKLDRDTKEEKYRQQRSYKNFDEKEFKDELKRREITYHVTRENDLDRAAKVFGEIFRKTLDRHAPVRRWLVKKIRKRRRK